MTVAERRLHAMRDLIAHARKRMGLETGFVLWDGSTVPADLSPSAFAIVIATKVRSLR